MSGGDVRGRFLYSLPPSVLWEFCRVMDGLSDLDWIRFASEVLREQTAVRLAERRERRTDWVMNQWGNRNGKVGELIDLLEHLQLLRARDVILCWVSGLKPSSSPPPPAPPPFPVSLEFDPPSKSSRSPSTLPTCALGTSVDKGGGRPLPRPAPPPASLQSNLPRTLQPPLVAPCSSSGAGAGVMNWSFEEVHAGTEGFSPSLQVGEGGFGVVYRATLRNTDCAVKRLKQDCLSDWTRLKESFQNEVDKLSKFRHPNIVDLLGFSEGRGSVCLIYSYMENRSMDDQLHNERRGLSWSQRVAVAEGASAALQFLHSPPDGHAPLIHGDVKSSNILLDRHLVPKLADFGLARLGCRGSGPQTMSVGRTATIRGTLAYLPEEYVRRGELSSAIDVYSFGVVLLEVLTGRRALETDRKLGERYLKDLMDELEESPTGSPATAWRKQLDHRLITGGAAEPGGWPELAALACSCLDRKRKKRPSMDKVFEKLRDVHDMVRRTTPSPLPLSSSPPGSPTSVVGLSRLGPLAGADEPPLASQTSCSSSSPLTPPHPLHCSSSSLTTCSSSFAGPCETDESRGFSQYVLPSQFSCISLAPSGPTEDQYTFTPQPSSNSEGPEVPLGVSTEPGTSNPDGLSPVGSLQSVSPGAPVQVEKKSRNQAGWIRGLQPLPSDASYEASIGPEESDELEHP